MPSITESQIDEAIRMNCNLIRSASAGKIDAYAGVLSFYEVLLELKEVKRALAHAETCLIDKNEELALAMNAEKYRFSIAVHKAVRE